MIDFLFRLDLWIQVYCLLLFCVFGIFAFRAWRDARSVRQAAVVLSKALGMAGSAAGAERVDGLPLERIEELRAKAERLPPLPASWWSRLDGALSPYGADPRARGWYLAVPASEVLDEDVVIHQHYDAGFYGGVPGLLTSLGLLGTFVAILMGLGALRPEGEVIKGAPELVASLSGKFTTSVIALALSAIYTVLEGVTFQAKMRAAREHLIGRVHDVLPRLTTARVLVDLQSESVKQTRSLANISSDLVDKVASVFAREFRENVAPGFAAGVSSGMADKLSQELVPALNRVTETMTQVSSAVQRLESGKQESVVGEIRGLTQSLERSLANSLTEMGAQFRDALRGSTRDEFSGLAKTLQDSAGVLAQMNESFATMQSALGALIDESRSTTSAQIAKSAERAEQLNQLVEALLVRLNESASQNASHINGVLTHVVTELSERVSTLSTELTTQVAKASVQTQAAAAESLRVAGDWSAKSDQRLTELLTTLEAKVTDFDNAGVALVSAQRVLEATLAQSADGLRSMQQAAGEVRTYSTGLAGLQSKVTEAQTAQASVTVATKHAIEQLTEMSQRHDALLVQYDSTFTQAQRVFDGLDDRLRRVLETILEKVQQYNVGVERNFQAIVGDMNTTMPQMGEVLAGAAVELREQVDELTEVLATANRSRR